MWIFLLGLVLLNYHCVGDARHIFDREFALCDDANPDKPSLRNRDFSGGFSLANFNVLATDDGFRVLGDNVNDQAGSSLASGDINGDGIRDILIAAPNAALGRGAVYVLFGQREKLNNIDLSSLSIVSTNQGFRILGAEPNDQLGSSLASGDINGDGIDDVLIGAVNVSEGASMENGAVYVVFGKKEGLNHLNLASLPAEDGFRILGEAPGDHLGSALVSGDINADGIDDVLVSSTDNNFGSGAVYVVFGEGIRQGNISLSSLSGSANEDGFRISGTSLSRAGYIISSGDINGDGIRDILLGTLGTGVGIGMNRRAVYVIFGKQTNWENIDLSASLTHEGFTIIGDETDPQVEMSLASGDINGDGIDDVMISVFSENNSADMSRGMIFIIFGSGTPIDVDLSASLDPSQNGFGILGAAVGDKAGSSLASGDINGDGIDDALIGAIGVDDDMNTDSGALYVIFGKEKEIIHVDLSLFSSTHGFRILGASALHNLGDSAASGDINGDGIGDILVGAERAQGRGAGYNLLGACQP